MEEGRHTFVLFFLFLGSVVISVYLASAKPIAVAGWFGFVLGFISFMNGYPRQSWIWFWIVSGFISSALYHLLWKGVLFESEADDLPYWDIFVSGLWILFVVLLFRLLLHKRFQTPFFAPRRDF